MAEGHGVEDRVLPATRWTAAVVGVVLAVAGVMLLGFPDRTDQLWAWEMGPPPTSMAVGGGYLAGSTFFLRAARAPRWHPLGVTFLAATVLSGLLLVATLLHWEVFNHRHVSFWAWALLYVVTPVLLPVLWARNRPQDPGAGVGGPRVPRTVRWVVGAVGIVQGTAALAFFAHPPLAMGWWPWSLSPLTTRTISAFLAFVAVVWLAFLWEARWSALRLHVESVLAGLVLVAIGLVVAGGDLTGSTVATAVVAALLLGMVAGISLLLLAMRWTPDGGGTVGGSRPGQ